MSLSNFWGKMFTSTGARPKEIDEINSLEESLKNLSDVDLKKESESLKAKAHGGEDLNSLLVRAFAIVREASRRTLGQRHYDVQLWGGIILHRGAIAEMLTGEG